MFLNFVFGLVANHPFLRLFFFSGFSLTLPFRIASQLIWIFYITGSMVKGDVGLDAAESSMIKDRLTRGFIAGLAGGLSINIISFVSYYTNVGELRFLDWAGIMLFQVAQFLVAGLCPGRSTPESRYSGGSLCLPPSANNGTETTFSKGGFSG